jgi:hypothetical protein
LALIILKIGVIAEIEEDKLVGYLSCVYITIWGINLNKGKIKK